MAARRATRKNHLRLVEPADPAVQLRTGEIREEIEHLVDVLIEILDVADGNPDAEPDDNECEDDNA